MKINISCMRAVALMQTAAICLSIGACSAIPGAGPSSDAFVRAASEPAPRLAFIEISDPILAEMARWSGPSLYGRFGDYREPAVEKIGVGDWVQVTIWEAAAGGLFSSPDVDPKSAGSRTAAIPPQAVARDGSITVPYAGRVVVANRTPPQVESDIVARLQGKAIDPQALVTITQNIANTATVTGEVVNGARVPLTTRGDRIMDVIAVAGGVKAPVHESFINLARGSRVARVAMQRLLIDPKENIYVRAGDVIMVVRDPQTFTAVGATGLNAVVAFDAVGITLEEALGKAGGLIDERADPRGVFVLRYEPSDRMRAMPGVPPDLLAADRVPVAYHLDLRNPTALFAARLFPIRNKDIVYVSDSPITDLQKVMNLFNAAATPAVTAATIRADIH